MMLSPRASVRNLNLVSIPICDEVIRHTVDSAQRA